MLENLKRFYDSHHRIIAAIFAVAIITFAGYYVKVAREKKSDIAVEPEEVYLPKNSSVSAQKRPDLEVPDQPAGTSVKVNSITLTASVWAVVHDDTGGKPGRILGAQRFHPGATKQGTIDLLRPTISGVYYVMVHRDDGDAEFDAKKDLPQEIDGAPVMVRFVAGGEI